jgi:hypothetical protein
MPFYRAASLLVTCILFVRAETVPAQHVPSKSEPRDAEAKITEDKGVSNVAAEKPVIVIAGLCNREPQNQNSACKTIVTRSQFERVITAIQPDMPVHARRAFALTYADALVLVERAEQMGLDTGPTFEEQMELARIDILTRALRNEILAKASQISEEDIETYYKDNRIMFEKAQVDRLFIPTTSQSESVSTSRVESAGQQGSSKGLKERSRTEADTLRAHAASGVDFSILQHEAYQNAGIQSGSPDTDMWIRSISLPPNQRVVMALQPGEVSPVLKDPNGYVIYKMVREEVLPLAEVRNQIKETLRSQRAQEQMRSISNSATTTLNEAYFSR